MLHNSPTSTSRVRVRTRRGNAGFTLIEAMVAVAILSIGIVSVMVALGAMAKTTAKLRTKEVMERLAQRKYEELLVTSLTLTSPQNGDFKDWNENRFTWSTDVETTGVDNLDAITLTVTPAGGGTSADKVVITGLVYVPPATSTTTTTP